MSIQGLKLAGAAISVWRGVKSTQAAPASLTQSFAGK